MRKLLLRNSQSPGDILMLTAAVRDLHATYPGQFSTDVRTSCRDLWNHNPYLIRIEESDAAAEQIECQYPLVHKSNERPVHFLYGFAECLNEQLGLQIRPTLFKGDVHLASQEKRWMSQVQELTREPIPFWIIVAGGKYDFTIKWWELQRYQEVVDHFQGRIFFVQVGEEKHAHKPLRGVLDLRGKTDLRQFIRLMHHAQGVLCPVTFAMHLAAAVETRPGLPKHRPCVVVAGGREPVHWEAYPQHQFIHTVGALPCCAFGGCWRSRTVRLGDGDPKDESLCTNLAGNLPKCMDMISSAEVIRRISLYFDGGVVQYLTTGEGRRAAETIAISPKARSGPEVPVLPPAT